MRYHIFGESHGEAIGVVLEDVPPGLPIDQEQIQREMNRRKPGRNLLSTARAEDDAVHIISGVFEGYTTGTPLCAMIPNTDVRSQSYQRNIPRPGHADYTGYVRYRGYNDYRGGGHFSGRLTAPIVFAGVLARQILSAQGITIGAHILCAGGVYDQTFQEQVPDAPTLEAVRWKPFPVLDDAAGEQMKAAILEARTEGDSVGGRVECAIVGLPAGIGSPDYGYNLEGELARALFAVPAVKAVGFGAAEDFACMRGSQANDSFYFDKDVVRTRTNHAGGINGGISNGMPIVFRVTMRPTPSIARLQESVDLAKKESTELAVSGRHDPCIVHRAVPVIEAAAAVALTAIFAEQGAD